MLYSIAEIAAIVGASLPSPPATAHQEKHITNLLTDSRSLCDYETAVFFALKTSTGDGHRYVEELYRKGVRCFVVSDLPTATSTPTDQAVFLQVVSPLLALQQLAAHHRLRFSIPIIGITGSNGKTIIKEWLYQLLLNEARITRSPRSYNSQIGVPQSVCLLEEATEIGIFEAGISRPREMAALASMIRPTIGILSNIGEAHQENFATRQEKCREKLQLFQDCPKLVYCCDDPLLNETLQAFSYRGQCYAWSRQNHPLARWKIRVEKQEHSSHIEAIDTTASSSSVQHSNQSFLLPFTDEASIENAIHCWVLLQVLAAEGRVRLSMVLPRFAQLLPVAMRLEVKQGERNNIVIDDTYNSDLKSLEIALDFLARRANGKKTTLILSDMQQSGYHAQELYPKVLQQVARYGVERLVGIGPEISTFAHCWKGKQAFFADTSACLQSGLLEQLENEAILLKGAREFGFEAIADELQQKLHETTLEVNLSAIADNLRHYRSLLSSSTQLICMIKANAYGCGSVEIARTLQDLGVNYVAVAVADEGAELRKAGITMGIIVMNPEINGLRMLFKYNLEPEIYNFRLLEAMIKAARAQGITHYPIHLKLDTGMCRLGFSPEKDMPLLAMQLNAQQALRPRSIFTHFVGSDAEEFDTFSQQQFQRFQMAADQLQAQLPHKMWRHLCNSAAIARFSPYHLDMCRLGLGLYGIDPVSGDFLQAAATLRTTILQIREVEAQSSVGYSRRTILQKPSRIAALPIGYADGLNRLLGNGRGYCWVNGKKAPYVGNICMDVCMIDVSDIDCQEGDRVEIFGTQLSPTLMAAQLGTIPYEILTSVSQRVKRIYYQ